MSQTSFALPAPLTPARWPIRAWFGVEIFFAIASSYALFLFPGNAADNFAWPVKPVTVGAFFGAIYFSAGVTMLCALFIRHWENMRVVVLPAAYFTAIMLVPTFLHLEKFSTGHIAFWVWLASYVLPPIVFLACYVWQQQRANPVGYNVTAPLLNWVHRLFFYHGWALFAAGMLFMIVPSLLQAIAPFPMTPLTARALGGYLTLPALIQVSMANENDWTRAKLGTTIQIALPVAVLVQLIRFPQDADWTNPLLWILILDFALIAGLCAWLWQQNERLL